MNSGSMDGVLVLSTGSICGEKNNVVLREKGPYVLVNGELVGCEGTSLVGDTSQFFDVVIQVMMALCLTSC